jgi:hypothetical protein
MLGRGSVLVALLLSFAACDKKPKALPDAPPIPDDAAVDAMPVPDAMPPDAAVSPQGQELTGAGGRMQGTNYILDVQVGHGAGQQPAQGSATVIEGNAPVKP